MNNENEIIKQICNEDVERKSKIDKLCQSHRLSEKEKNEIIDFTQEFGDTLSDVHVWHLLHDKENKVTTTTYRRASDDQSCFSVFTIDVDYENKELTLHLKAICSSGRRHKKTKENSTLNILQYSFEKMMTRKTKSDGDYALFDLEFRLRCILNSSEFRYYKAKIQLESINKEYVISFYVRNGYTLDCTRTSEYLVPMKKLITETKGFELFPEDFGSQKSRSQKMKLIYKYQKKIFNEKTLEYKGNCYYKLIWYVIIN